MSIRKAVDAIRIQYDSRTDIRDIYPGTRPERIRKDEIEIVDELIGWAPYTHHVITRNGYGDADHWHAIIPDSTDE